MLEQVAQEIVRLAMGVSPLYGIAAIVLLALLLVVAPAAIRSAPPADVPSAQPDLGGSPDPEPAKWADNVEQNDRPLAADESGGG
jgi:hypothetical protein